MNKDSLGLLSVIYGNLIHLEESVILTYVLNLIIHCHTTVCPPIRGDTHKH